MSIEIVKQEDYDVNLQYVLEQFKNSENMVDMIQAFNEQMSTVEDAIFEIRDNFYLDTAEGVQLDAIGAIFNELRRGRNDTEYRTAIGTKGSSFYSGTPEDVISQLKRVYGATSVIYYDSDAVGEVAAYVVITDGVVTNTELEQISPAGVQPYVGAFLIQEDPQGFYIETESGQKIISI